MASNIYLISGGVNYYLSGGSVTQTEYAGSGTPWTSQTTTPYELSMNDVTGAVWTPQAAQRQELFGGGPPFRNGQTLLYDSYGNVTEQVGIQMRATSHDNAVALLQQLRQILNTALFSTPCILAVQPSGASNVAYYEIYGADVQETPAFINHEAGVAAAGHALLRAVITWRRSPHGTAGATTTVINAQTFNNTGTGSPDNIVALSALTGDHIYEGMPLNMRFTGVAAQGNMYVAVVYERVYTSTNNAQTTSTTADFTTATPNLDSARTRAVKLRVLGRLKTLTNPAKMKFRASVTLGSTGYTTAYQTFPAGSGTASYLMDFGAFDPHIFRSYLGTNLRPVVTITLASTDGTSVTATLDYIEVLVYYTFLRVAAGATVTDDVVIEQVAPYNASALYFPVRARAYEYTSDITQLYATAGTFPRYFSGASVYLAWMVGIPANSTHTTTAAATVTMVGLPTYASLRGAG